MLKVYELQAEIMKDAYKRNAMIGKGGFSWMYAKDAEGNLLISKGHAIGVIPANMVFIDSETVFKDRQPMKGLLDYMKEIPEDASLITNTNVIVRITPSSHNKKGELEVLQNEKTGEKIYINPSIAKHLDLKDCTLYGTTAKKAIYVMYAGEMIGLILPVNYNREEN